MKVISRSLTLIITFAFGFQGCVKSPNTVNDTAQVGTPPATAMPVDNAIYGEHVRTTDYQTPEEERLSFVLPPGFEATLFASEPDITKPINMAFDAKGRLWVSQSSEYPIEAGPGGGKDRITILEDTNGDGRADKITDFANDLNIPIGIMPIKGGAIGYSIPNIYKFLDTDDDGRADKREVMLGEFGHKDTHGMVNNLIRGFDGWIHASHGYANTSKIAGKDGDSITMFSGNTFRFKADGSRVEKTTDGRINPFGSAFDEMGYHYSADCHTLPIYQLIWGGDYTQWGKKERSMGFAPTMMDYGLNSTALAGLVYYTDIQFPVEYRNSFYSGDVVTCRISRNIMEFKGTTPKATRKEDFLVSRDPWFRPVDIKIGPDGAMYIADFYNRIIGHYEVPINHPGRDRVSGRIWKITYKGNKNNVVTDWSKASMSKLQAGMKHEVLAIRMRATDELVDRIGSKAAKPLLKITRSKNTAPEQLIQTIWALYRLNALPTPVLVSAINHTDVRVKVHAFKVAANYAMLPEELRQTALQNLAHPNPHVQRAAAEVLGRHPDVKSNRKLVSFVNQVPDYDSHLRYTALLGIKNHLGQTHIMQHALQEKWNEKEAETLAMVAADLNSVPAGRYLLQYLRTYEPTPARQLVYAQAAAHNLPESEVSELMLLAKKRAANNSDLQYQLAKAITAGLEQRGLQTNAALRNWNIELATHFLENIPAEASGFTVPVKARQLYAAEIAGRYKIAALEPALKKLLLTRYADEESRSAAASALMNVAPQKNAVVIFNTLANGEEATTMRQKLVQALGQSQLPEVQSLLGKSLRETPYEVQITTVGLLIKSPEGKARVLKLIRQGYAPARLLKARGIEEVFLADLAPGLQQDFKELTANILPISEERQQLIEKRMAEFDAKGKTPVMGNAIFIKNCSMCHQINKKGGLIGPQLDGIGNWGRNALTTKILDPNRNISEAFRSYNITLKDGKTLSGLYRREEGQLLVLANAAGQEFSVSQQDIKEKVASKYTLMPDHFNSTIKKEDFDALLVFLLNEK